MNILEAARMGTRQATVEDLAFICSSWLASYEKPFVTATVPDPSWLPKSIGMIRKSPRLLKALYLKEERLAIAHAVELRIPTVIYDIDNPSFIVGWFCGTPGHVDYIYVKQAFRRQGIGEFILKTLGPVSTVSHLTSAGLELARSCAETPRFIG